VLGLTIPLMLLARWSHEVVLLGGVTVIVKTRLRGWGGETRTTESIWTEIRLSCRERILPDLAQGITRTGSTSPTFHIFRSLQSSRRVLIAVTRARFQVRQRAS